MASAAARVAGSQQTGGVAAASLRPMRHGKQRSWRRIITAWLALQLLAAPFATLASGQPLWSSFLEVLSGPVCIATRTADGDSPTPARDTHPAFCILCLAFGSPAVAEAPPLELPRPLLRHLPLPPPVESTVPASAVTGAKGCRGPPSLA